MPKVKKLLLIFVTAVLLTLAALLISCGNDGKGRLEKLPAPTGLEISDSDILTWNEVENAQGYVVDLDGVEYETDENSLDIFLLTAQYKTYSIKVMAIGDWERYDDSDWSSEITYEVSDYSDGFACYVTNENEVQIIAENKNYLSGKIIVPSYGKNAETGERLTVTTLPTGSFEDCTKMTSVILPETVTEIGISAFANCTSLVRVHLPQTITKIPSSAFEKCKKLRQIDIPESVEKIGGSAFAGCEELENISLPNDLRSIGTYAFKGCSNLKSFNLPAQVKKISAQDFQNCYDLSEITVDEHNEVYVGEGNCIIRKSDNTLILGGKASKIPSYVTTIGKQAFYGRSVTGIEIPNNIQTVELNAFAFCMEAKEIKLPASVIDIEGVFRGCDNVEKITVDSGNEVYYTEGNCIINKQTNSVDFGNQYSVIPTTVTRIGYGAFSGCKGITEFNIPPNIVEIGDGAFYGTSLTTVTVPSSVETIGGVAFENVTAYIQHGKEQALAWVNSFENSMIVYGCDITNEGNGYHYVNSFENTGYVISTVIINGGIIYFLQPPLQIPVRSGYTFKGWTTQEGGTEAEYKVYDSGDRGLVTLSKTERDSIPEGTYLYAIWEKNK